MQNESANSDSSGRNMWNMDMGMGSEAAVGGWLWVAICGWLVRLFIWNFIVCSILSCVSKIANGKLPGVQLIQRENLIAELQVIPIFPEVQQIFV